MRFITLLTRGLVGLGSVDLNALRMDTLGTLLYKYETLSDLLFQKTQYNLFFVLEFLRSLAKKGC